MPDVVFPLLFQHRSASTFQPLTCVLILSSHQASLLLTQNRNNPFGLTLKVFFTPYLARKLFLMPHPWIFAVFLYSRTPWGEPKFIRLDVRVLDSGVSSRVSVLCVWPTPLLIRILASCAVPLFPDKLLLLSRHLDKRLLRPSLSLAEIFITARDQAFFKALFFSGDRGGASQDI